MGFVKVGAIVPKLKVADVEFNVNEIINLINVAEEKKIQIACFPELCITGYSRYINRKIQTRFKKYFRGNKKFEYYKYIRNANKGRKSVI